MFVKFLASLCLMALLTPQRSSTKELDVDTFVSAWKSCSAKAYTELAVAQILIKSNEPEAECLIECYFRKLGVIKDNNRFDTEALDGVMRLWFGNDLGVAVGRKCAVYEVPKWDNCTGLHEAATCYVEESQRVKLTDVPLNKLVMAKLVEQVIENKIEEKIEEKIQEKIEEQQ